MRIWVRSDAIRGLVAAMACLGAALASDARAGTAEQAQALAERAAAHFGAVGRDRAFADFSRPDGGFVDGDLYVFCQTAAQTVLAHGGNPRLVGRNMAGVRDPDGRLPNAEIVRLALAQGHGWVEYRWPNPLTRRIEPKLSYVFRVDPQTVCGAGYYRSDLP